ncbi:hypothetical protein [Streptomyces sp. FH025]|uniref:hypothetical protein n=1 Tax=Streptomyces sp. FH025 TaxID=2815937 RepID=UPI001A9E094E|nr:hypothetical protein [Streptomyces sp. FH025]MBO1419581.1 hypothetical protein [Streptomyces sp. FH025]
MICTHAGTGGKTPVPRPSQGGGGGDDGGPQVCSYHGTEWACYDPELGYFNSDVGCYFRPLSPQPPEGDAAWEGHKPSEGAVYSKMCPQTGGGQDGLSTVFVSNAAGSTPVIDLTVQGKLLAGRMAFPTPVASFAPKDTAVVKAPVWLWAEGMVAPAPSSLSVPGASVTVTARLKGMTWDFGDGMSVDCATAGTPYDPKYGGAKSPDCGYEFPVGSGTKKGGVFSGTVTANWQAHVVITGPNAKTFDLDMPRGADLALRVAEMQVLN